MSRVNILYKITSIILVLIIAVTGYNWITTPHLSPDINLKCEIPDTPDQIIKLVLVREIYGTQEAYRPYNFAQRFAGFSGMTGSKGSDPRIYYYGLYNLTFYGVGMSHFEFDMPYKERYRVEVLSEEQCIEKADQLIEEIREYFNSSLEYRVEKVEKIFPSYEFYEITPTTIYYYRIYYDIYYHGIELLGTGTDAWVEVCDEEILGYRLHFPVLEERGIDKVCLTPIEALNRLEAGSIVYEVKFGYYADFVHPEFYSVVEYGYLVNGDVNKEFAPKCADVFIPAMAGDVYK